MENHYQHNPQLLRIYLFYRVALSTILLAMFETGLGQNALGTHEPELFRWTIGFYTIISYGSLYIFRPSLLTRSLHRLTFLLIIDLIAMLLVIHASGGTDSGLGYLLLVCTAMASVFIRGQLALAYAALITLFLIAETIYITQDPKDLTKGLFSTGILGILVFVTTVTFLYLTEKIRSSDIAAVTQAKYAEHLEKLAQHIVTRMRTGVVVIDGENKIELINESALQLLDLPQDTAYIGAPLSDFSNLDDMLKQWQYNPVIGLPKVHALRDGHEVRINFAQLETNELARTILYIEDHRAIVQQAQQLKLASLGRLTASIAHEVRNPLGAIAHAAQLLKESDTIDAGDNRLTEIILQHSERVNQIINNTLVLSRRKEPKPELLDLATWLPHFINSFQLAVEGKIDLHLDHAQIRAKADPSQLTQVLTNLCENGLRHSKLLTGEARIKLCANISANDHTPYIDVIDFGEGVPEALLQQIFDPFFTTDDKGTGLGLYISKELCEINQASLHYSRTQDGMSCFRISFSHHQRKI